MNTKPAFPYLSGKQKLAQRIAPMLPPSRIYLEPFSGMASVYLAKEPTSEVSILNDRDERLVNLLRVARDDGPRLGRWIEESPFARSELAWALPQDDPDPFIRAGQTALVILMTFQSATKGTESNFSIAFTHARRVKRIRNLGDRLATMTEKLLGVQFENRPATKLIERLSQEMDCTMYCDPPYMTQSGRAYGVTMTDQEHEERLNLLVTVQGHVAISGYDTPLYADMLKDWTRYEWKQYATVSRVMKDAKQEVMWTNYNPIDYTVQTPDTAGRDLFAS